MRVDAVMDAVEPDISGVHQYKVWLEVIGLALFLPIILWLSGKSLIVLLDTFFPWLMLPPVLVALRYGTIKGLVTLGILTILLALSVQHNQLDFTYAYLERWVGSVIITVISGEIASHWQQRFLKQKTMAQTIRSTLQKTEQSMQMLQLSHAQLEEEMLGATQSLKSSLDIVERTIPSNLSAQERKQWLVGQMMVVLSTYDWLETASFLQVDTHGKVSFKPLAKIGTPSQLSKHDFLIQDALYKGKPVHVKRDLYMSDHYKRLGTPLIAAIPVIDNKHQIQAILTIEHLNFVAFNSKNLNLLAALCAWLGGLLSADVTAEPVQTRLSSKAAIDEMHSALLVIMSHKRSVALSHIWLPKTAKGEAYLGFFQSVLQDKNRMWVADWDDQLCLHLLLPWLKAEQITGYESHVEQMFLRHFGHNLRYADVAIETQHMEDYENKYQLVNALSRSQKQEG